MGRVEGKVAIVTGGASGLGSAVCERLVEEGAKVVVAGRDLDKAGALAERLGDAAAAVGFDAEDPASIEALVETTVERFGRLDFLDNNAALTSRATDYQDRTTTDTPLDVWDRVMTVNLRACFLSCKFAIPHMVAGGGGSIVNTASTSALAGDAVRIAYGTSKAGLIAMSKYIAAQHGREGIRCNALVPGLIPTPDLAKGNPDLLRVLEPHALGNRLGRPEDIAAMALYLASDESGYVTGQALNVDGGILAAMPFLPAVRGEDVRA